MARKSRKAKDQPEIFAPKRCRTAIYARLSGKGKTEETIEAQVALVRSFLSDKPQFEVVSVFEDDGYSGTNWDRPSFKKMMDAVRNGEVDCIVVKDLSRFAREHIGAEDYLNNIFPFLGVRFISVTDGYDNIRIEPQEFFLASFKNLAHAYFAQETSRKTSQAYRVVQEKGLYIGSHAPFGYELVPDHPHELRINEEQAAIVREVFERYASGETYPDITAAMCERYPDAAAWSEVKIGRLLNRELYIGTVVTHTSEQAMYKGEAWHKIPKEQQFRTEHAAPAIISKELWERVQKILALRKTKFVPMEVNPFEGLTFCAVCGSEIKAVHHKKRKAFYFNCRKCHSGVYCNGGALLRLAAECLQCSEEITPELAKQHISKIIIRDRKHIMILNQEGQAYENSLLCTDFQ